MLFTLFDEVAVKTNRHPVDELSDIRAEMKRLKAREDEIRDDILEGRCGLVGDQFDARVTNSESERVDTAALRKEFGLERLRPYLKKSVTRTIRISERVMPDDA